MKTILDNKKVLLLFPVLFSVFLLATIITATPTSLSSNSSPNTSNELVAQEETKNTVEPNATETVNSAAPSPPPAVPIAPTASKAPAKTNSPPAPKKQVSTQPSRSSSKLTPPPSSTKTSKASAIIATSKKYIGVKYVYGGTTPAGFDCSGFTQYVFAKHGISLPRVSRDQFKVGTAVSFSNLKPGDLIFFSIAKNRTVDHVGIYVGNGQFINASSSKGVTIYTFGTYWKSVFIGAKRVL